MGVNGGKVGTLNLARNLQKIFVSGFVLIYGHKKSLPASHDTDRPNEKEKSSKCETLTLEETVR